MVKVLRITKLQAELLKPAVRHIFINHTNFKHTGRFLDCHPDIPYSGGSRRFGKDQSCIHGSHA